MEKGDIVHMIRMLAREYGVRPGLAVSICRRESGFDPMAVGDNGAALGLYQWHKPSWTHVRVRMNRGILDLRHDPFAATETAMYAMGILGLYGWWSTYQAALDETAATKERGVDNRLKLEKIEGIITRILAERDERLTIVLAGREAIEPSYEAVDVAEWIKEILDQDKE